MLNSVAMQTELLAKKHVTFRKLDASYRKAAHSRTMQLTYFAIVVVTILLHAIFVASEYAVVKTTSVDLNSLVRSKALSPCRIAVQDLEKYLQTCQIGKTIALTSLGVCLGMVLQLELNKLGTPAATANLGLIGLGFLTVVLAQLVVGFEVPKWLGITRSEQCVKALSGFIRASQILLFPVAWAVRQLATFTAKRRT